MRLDPERRPDVDLLIFVLNPNAIGAQGDATTLWEQLFQLLRLALIGPISRVLALIAIVVGALMLYLDSHRHNREKLGGVEGE